MAKWRELVDPRQLASSFEATLNFKRAVSVYLLAILSAIGTALYYGIYKLKIGFFMPILRTINPPYTSTWDIVLGRIIYVVFGMIIVLFILRVALLFAKREGIKSYPLVSIILHSLLAIVIISVIFFISAVSSPPVEVNIVSATLNNVKLTGVELSGRYLSNLSNVKVMVDAMSAEQLIATSVFSNGSIPNWSEIYQRGGTIDLDQLKEYVTIKSASAYTDNRILALGDVEVSKLKWRSIEFSSITDMLYYPVPFLNFVAGMLSLFSWIWIIGYSSLAVKYYYSLSTGTIIIVDIVTFLALFIFGFV
jgi:hypothetical protein